MTDAERLLDELLELPRDDRAVIAAILTDSLEHDRSPAIEAAWIAEAKLRLEAVRSGRSIPVASELVEEELDAIVARATLAARATG
jgi:putative addiction module component (TIGR02574 family)